jgi:hypothetical protein
MKILKSVCAAFKQSLGGICVMLALVGCAANSPLPVRGDESGAQARTDYLPGGVVFYSMGQSQPKENFQNIEIAQFEYSKYSKQRSWVKLTPGKAPGMLNMFQSYVPLSVRWKLKDGREFMLENIDIRSIMREYFKSNDIKMQWQKEGREKAKSGDAFPALVFEVKDDVVILKWLVMTNHTPVDQRFTAKGAATKWEISDEEFIVAHLKGLPTQGIDFTKVWEFDCPGPKCRKE